MTNAATALGNMKYYSIGDKMLLSFQLKFYIIYEIGDYDIKLDKYSIQ